MFQKMNLIQSIFVALFVNYVYCVNNPAPHGSAFAVSAEISPNAYPNARRDETVQDIYPGNVIVHDAYRWLENPKSEETKKFIKDEDALTESYLKNATFHQIELRDKFQEIDLHNSYNGPNQVGKYWFSFRNDGQRVQDVIYAQESLTGPAKVVLDPNTLSNDGSIILDIDSSSFSEDGLILAYSTINGGSDWRTAQFLNVEKGNIYKEKLTKIKFSQLEWTFDNKGVFYAAYPDAKDLTGAETESNTRRKIFYHVVGTEQSKDVVVVEFPNEPDTFMSAKVSIDGKYLIVQTQNSKSAGNSFYVADLVKNKEIKGKLELTPIITKDPEHQYNYVGNIDKTFILQTNKDAPNNKLVTVDIGCPDPVKSMKDLIPTHEKDPLAGSVAAYGKYLILNYTQDLKSVIQLHCIRTGELIKKFETEIGSIKSLYGGWKYKDIYFTIESYLTPGITYHCDLSKPPFDLDVFQEVKLNNFDRQKFTTEQIFYKSKDGTKIPMYIVSKKGVQKNGNNFTFLYGFGGFASSSLPTFDTKTIVIMNNFDGVYAVANIRGGGEYGENWHQDGSMHKKQNSFNDFQAAAEYLIAEKYTSSKMLVINGASNGGLLVAVCLNQRPELFGAGIAEMGVLDMLRFDKFTGGKDWVTEYGDPSIKPDFDVLFKYSPLHNIKIPEDPHLQYPATMLTTSLHDDRVPPLHSFKFIATLQHLAKCCNPKQKNPLIISIKENPGQDGGTAVDDMFQFIDEMSFISIALGIKFHT